MKKEEKSGAQALVDSLAKAGTEVLFGYPGGQALDIFNCLPEAPFQFILGRHEQGCVHMADGYARSLGKVGVCLVTSGPGATNTITGLATANMDGVPLVCITGQVPMSQIGTDAFQEADMSGICRAVTKHSFLVQSADEIPETVAEAFYIATHGKPGPVVIDIPKNVQRAMTSAQYPERVSLRAYHPESMATSSQMTRFAKLVNEAKRPVLYAGGGVIAAGAANDLARLAHKAQIPVATTLMGLGAFDEHDPLSLRFAGMHGAYAANMAIDQADLVVALGVRFSDRVTGKLAAYAHHAKMIHVDCDPSSIGKNVPVDLGIVADVKDVLTTVNSRIRHAEHGEWLARIDEWRRKHPISYSPMHKNVIMPQQVIESIDRASRGRAVIVTDVGQHQMWSAQFFRHNRARHFLTSGGMGTMGFGIPAAIGAAIARPDHKTVAVCGDGGAQMTFEEVVVAVEHKLPVTFVVINNECLGMVRQWQELFYGKRYSGSILSMKGRLANERIEQDLKYDYLPDMKRLAEAHGAEAYRVIDPAKLDSTIRKAMNSKRTTFVEVIVEPRANVYPMQPGGQPVEGMIFG
ncbi:MAG: biosynthetic-type acetolactate synthase large subunit [Verrucomicrobiota bacterium]|nr:biosynthetic-type acetolactate synthase large subunit [Verrucomicrobiota bacterium]MDY5596276.1 biosynthetic-type acetolactate synthase large subunit [Kiritimatiellia bacterium]